jgi:hypothetical protein
MGAAAKSGDGGNKELEDLIHQLSDRVVGKMIVVNGKTGERSQMVSFDFDARDSIEVMFEGVPPVEGEEEIFTYSFPKESDNAEADLEMARDGYRKGGNSSAETLEAALGEALRESDLENREPTYEDFLINIDIHFEDLSQPEKNKAMIHDLDDLLDLYESLGYSEEEKKKTKKGFFSKMFS